MITIENCKFAFRCPRDWHKLSKIEGQPRIRYCDGCQKTVHYCDVDDELMERVRSGSCVAIMRTPDVDFPDDPGPKPNSSLRPPQEVWLGIVLKEYEPASSLNWD